MCIKRQNTGGKKTNMYIFEDLCLTDKLMRRTLNTTEGNLFLELYNQRNPLARSVGFRTKNTVHLNIFKTLRTVKEEKTLITYKEPVKVSTDSMCIPPYTFKHIQQLYQKMMIQAPDPVGFYIRQGDNLCSFDIVQRILPNDLPKPTKTESATIRDLPFEILRHIVTFIEPGLKETLRNVRQTCRVLKLAADEKLFAGIHINRRGIRNCIEMADTATLEHTKLVVMNDFNVSSFRHDIDCDFLPTKNELLKFSSKCKRIPVFTGMGHAPFIFFYVGLSLENDRAVARTMIDILSARGLEMFLQLEWGDVNFISYENELSQPIIQSLQVMAEKTPVSRRLYEMPIVGGVGGKRRSLQVQVILANTPLRGDSDYMVTEDDASYWDSLKSDTWLTRWNIKLQYNFAIGLGGRVSHVD